MRYERENEERRERREKEVENDEWWGRVLVPFFFFYGCYIYGIL